VGFPAVFQSPEAVFGDSCGVLGHGVVLSGYLFGAF
jgi:hypothetical protein